MTCKHYMASIALVATMALTTVGVAQSARPITWSQDLEYLQKLPPSDATAQQGTISSIRAEVERWVKLHPEKKVTLSPAPARPWTAEQTQTQIKEIAEALSVISADEAHPFHLGQTDVAVSADLALPTPLAVSIGQEQLQATNTLRLTGAIDQLPGVEINRAANFKNITSYYLRGFNNLEVPLYLDGVPQYVPYDGSFDIKRFLTGDLAEVQVSRGVASPLLGPNALGGSINLVTREPQKPYEANLSIGTGAGNQLNATAILGRRTEKYFLQGTLNWAQRDYIPLPGGFVWPATNYPNSGSGTVVQLGSKQYPNSYSYDQKYSGRIGWTPKKGDQYVFSYSTQKGKDSGLIYLGPNTATWITSTIWPYWSMDGFYFTSKTQITQKESIKTRLYYQRYFNEMAQYQKLDYSVPNYLSYYRDHTDGLAIEAHSSRFKRNAISVAFNFKDDTHHDWSFGSMTKPNSTSYSTYTTASVISPWRTLRNQLYSFGVEDLVTVTPRLTITGGFSIDAISGKTVQVYDKGTVINGVTYYNIKPNTCVASPTNTTDYSACTPHYSTYNPQVIGTYKVGENDRAYASFSYRSRFPVMSDLYSTGGGSSYPNPDLQAEHAKNWNFGYTHVFTPRITADLQMFRSDVTNSFVSGYGYTTTKINPADTVTATSTCPNNPSNKNCYAYSYKWNAGNVVLEGVEAQVHARVIERVSLDANYSYLNRWINPTNAYPSNVPSIFDGGIDKGTSSTTAYTGVPRHKLSMLTTINGPYGIVGTLRERYEGPTMVSDSNVAAVTKLHPNATIVGSYAYWKTAMAVTDLNVKVPVYKGLEVQGGVNNALDRSYAYGSGYPEEGRNWFFNMRYQY